MWKLFLIGGLTLTTILWADEPTWPLYSQSLQNYVKEIDALKSKLEVLKEKKRALFQNNPIEGPEDRGVAGARGPAETRQAYELLRAGHVRPDRLITHRFRLDDVQAAYDTARQGGEVLKVLVTMAESFHANE